MRTFKDQQGRTWTLHLDARGLRDVRSALEVNLLAIADDEFALLKQLGSEPWLLVDVLFVLCRRQAESAGVSDEEFGTAMRGDALDAAFDALLREIVDFFPSRRGREALQRILETGRTLAAKVMDRSETSLDELAKMDLDSMADELMHSFGKPPESSASTPQL